MRRADVTRESGAVAAGVAGASCAVGLTAVASWLIATAAGHPALSTLTVAIVAVRACGVGRGALRYVERLTGHDAVLRRLGDVRAHIVGKLAVLAPAGLPELRAGDLTTRLVQDVDSTADRTLRLQMPSLVAASVGALATIGAAFIFPAAAVALAAALLVMAFGGPAIARQVAKRNRQFVAPRRGDYASAVTQTLHGAADLIAFDAVPEAMARLDAADQSVAHAARSTAWRQGLAAAIGVAAAGAVPLVALWLGVPAASHGNLAPALLAVIVLAPLAVYEVFAPLPLAAALSPEFAAAAARVAEVQTRTSPVEEPLNAAVREPIASSNGGRREAYQLEVVDLAARWPAFDHHPDAPVAVSNVSFELAPGRRVAVVGPSGSGKSTLAAVLVRFLEPEAGTVRIGGVDIKEMSSDRVRQIVGLCAQDAYVFDSTLAENVRLARPSSTDDDVRDALERAGLGDWLQSLPDGLRTRVGEHGAALSGGQRQRLSLARVLLADRPIVILDEPTEHLDDKIATALIADLLDATSGRSVVLMTHRRRDLAFVDAVVELSPSAVPATGN